jgi:hypothetical protein
MPVTRLVPLVFAASSLLLSACELHGPVHEEELTLPGASRSSLAINVGWGDVHVIGAEVSVVSVRARVQGASNHVSYGMSTGGLTLFDDCNEEPCSVDLTVTFPEGARLDVSTGTGDVRIENVRAPIALASGSGDISGSRLAGAELRARTGSGNLAFALLSEADHVQVETHSGDVALTVPSGSYRIDVSNGSGDQYITGLSADANAARAIVVDTGSGDVSIRGE